MKRWLTPYGNYFSITYKSVHVMVNGYMFSLYKSLSSDKYKVSCWSNVWRKNRTPLEV